MDASYDPASSATLAQLAGVYGALACGLGLLALKQYHRGLYLLAAMFCCLNFQYGPLGASRPISFFISIYDVTHSADELLGWNTTDLSRLGGMTPCTTGNTCTQLGQAASHPAWAAAFYDRFELGGVWRRARLYMHIWPNTFALCLGLAQFRTDLRVARPALHRRIGWATTALTFFSLANCLSLALEHGTVEAYGGNYAVVGWFSMAACVLVPLSVGVQRARDKDFDAHRRWMARYHGAMWGSFLVFRAIFLVIGPLLRWHKSAIVLLAIWGSAPLGVCIAEYWFNTGAAKLE